MSLKTKINYLFLAAVSLTAIFGAAVYYAFALNGLGISLTLLLAGAGLWFFGRMIFAKKSAAVSADDIAKNFIIPKTKISWKKSAIASAWLLPYFIFLFLLFYFLFSARTDSALTSPWEIVSARFFIAYILATAYLFFLILKNSKFTLGLIAVHYFLSFSVLWIVFKIGYGYDPFIHQATVALIDKQGAVWPKPFYYLGQYALILIAHKLFFLPIVWADKLLVPILAAITLPPASYLFLKKFLSSRLPSAGCQLLILIFLILPFSIFTLTVPQNLAYLFLILTIFISLTSASRTETILSFILALAALAAHPVAGLSALFFAIALAIYHLPSKSLCFWSKQALPEKEICVEKPRQDVLVIKSSERKTLPNDLRSLGAAILDFLFMKKLSYTVIFVLNAVSLPLLFWLVSKNNPAEAAASASGFPLPLISFPRRENIFLNLAYFFLDNQWLILVLFSGAAVYAVYRYRRTMAGLILPAGMAASLLVGYLLTRQINFSFLIGYERADFANRILITAFIFLLPVIAVIFSKLVSRILAAKTFVKYSWLALLVILIAVSLYGSYPRRDNYFNSHGFAVGASDLDAVNWIEQDARGTPYIVLADQQVSVAALWTFGFNRYRKTPSHSRGGGEIYFYPIPTGGPLYQYYLAMVYQKPVRATALAAADLTGVSTAYFVINKYWTGFDKIVEQAKVEAGSFQNINNGELYIFKYVK